MCAFAVVYRLANMIPTEPSSSDQLQPVSSSRDELSEQDCCTSPVLQTSEQPAQCSCRCQQEDKILDNPLRRLVPYRAAVITPRHRHRHAVKRRGTVPVHTRRHSVVQRLPIMSGDPDSEPALPWQVLWCYPNDLELLLRSSSIACRMLVWDFQLLNSDHFPKCLRFQDSRVDRTEQLDWQPWWRRHSVQSPR